MKLLLALAGLAFGTLLLPVPRERTPTSARGYLGVYVSQGDDDEASIRVSDVVPDNPAAVAGIRPGDLIVQFGHFRPKNKDELIARIGQHPPGATVSLTVNRSDVIKVFRITLARRPDDLPNVTPPPRDKR